MKQSLVVAALFIGLACAWFAATPMIQAADDGRVDIYFDGIRVGSDGTKISLLAAGDATVTSGTTEIVKTITSAATGDWVAVSPATALGSATKFYAALSGTTLTITVDQNPGANVKFNYLVLRL